MNEQQITIGILVSTIFIVALIITFLIILVKLHKRAIGAEKVLKNKEESLRENADELWKLRKLLGDQIPVQPIQKYIKYYSEHKPVEVHMIHKELGIAVISDVGQLNYKVRTVVELLDSSG